MVNIGRLHAQKGHTAVAFRYAKNYDSYAKAMKAKGYNVSYLRSSGPTVEGGYRSHAWYAVAHKKKNVRRAKPTRRAVRRTGFGGLPLRFKF